MPQRVPYTYKAQIALDAQRQTAFNGIPIPVTGIEVHSQGRQHLHEFPHSPGAAPEKLGRGIWHLTVECSFQVVFVKYPTSYPGDMRALRALYEQQITATFQHPNGDDFPAFIASWRQHWNPKLRSGERVQIEFLEDQRTTFLAAPSSTSTQGTSIGVQQSALDAQLQAIKSQLLVSETDLSVFDTLRAASNAVASLTGTVQLYTSLVQAKCAQLQSVCAQVEQLPSMQSPLAVGITDPLHNMWAAATSILQSTQAAQRLGRWVVPETMSLNAIARTLYGDASRYEELASLNSATIRDPNVVPAATRILYYLPSTGS